MHEGEAFQAADLEQAVAQARDEGGYAGRLLSSEHLSVGVYILPASGTDGQRPHRVDEVYFAARGAARFRAGTDDIEVRPGSLLFVRAGVEHGFHDITEELVLVVFWAPPEITI